VFFWDTESVTYVTGQGNNELIKLLACITEYKGIVTQNQVVSSEPVGFTLVPVPEKVQVVRAEFLQELLLRSGIAQTAPSLLTNPDFKGLKWSE